MKNSNCQHTPQTGAYKLKVKSGAAWRAFDTCRLQISVGQEKHEGEKFKATIEWALERFSKVIVCVNDTLQRFNLMADQNMEESEATLITHQAGTYWIAKNLNPYLNSNVEVHRWDEWLQSEEYKLGRPKIDRLHNINPDFKAAIDQEIDIFMQRRKQLGEAITDHHIEMSRQYLLEESTVFPIMFNKSKAADIYPGTTLLPVRLAEEGKIAGLNPTGQVTFTRVDFQRNKAFLGA